MATITRTQVFEDYTADLIAFEGFGASRKDRIAKVGANSAGHPLYNRRGSKAAGNSPVHTTMTGRIRITDTKGTDWFSVSTLDQPDKRTFYLAPETVVVVKQGDDFAAGTLAELYQTLSERD